MFKPTEDGRCGRDASPVPSIALSSLALGWDRVQRRLRAELGEDVFASWFKCLELSGGSADQIQLSVPTKFLKNWIQQHYLERIASHIAQEMPGIARISIVMRATGSAAGAARQDMASPAP
ncbi:MAG: hypothetical protein INF07_00605, partial [Methylobacterium sp.]|nr:hypothetical protein [Methylobacterium sp.]